MKIGIEHEIDCVNEIKRGIALPASDWFIRTDDSILFTYIVGGKMRFITIQEREEVATFLQENGRIEHFTGFGKNTKMYTKALLTVVGKNQEPVQWERYSEMPWEKISFTTSEVLHIAAKYEYEMTSKKIGIVGKLISITQHFLTAA